MKIKQLGLEDVRSVEWIEESNSLQLIDQRHIPFRISFTQISNVEEVCKSIKEMVVRGAPAIGVTAAYGIALGVKDIENLSEKEKEKRLEQYLKNIIATRPTAIDLSNFALETYKTAVNSEFSFEKTLQKAKDLANQMVEECKTIGINGADLIADGDTILTHCNAGSLATVDYGTALAPIFLAHKQGKKVKVLVDETRPRLQGAKITAWELEQEEIEHKIIPDSAAAFLMSKGKVDKVILGADRCLKNGIISNKIGTFSLAIAAKFHKIPFYSAFPWSTIDKESDNIESFEIEYRNEDEVKYVSSFEEKILIANQNSEALNPAFDITPAELITGYITAKGVLTRNQLKEEIIKKEK
ncbi:MAG: S-methyl-5-thioribose-1-phosphate isomerase [Candidatus Thorarchaeota archaeon]